MVVYADADGAQRIPDRARHLDVGLGGRGIARGVVVSLAGDLLFSLSRPNNTTLTIYAVYFRVMPKILRREAVETYQSTLYDSSSIWW